MSVSLASLVGTRVLFAQTNDDAWDQAWKQKWTDMKESQKAARAATKAQRECARQRRKEARRAAKARKRAAKVERARKRSAMTPEEKSAFKEERAALKAARKAAKAELKKRKKATKKTKKKDKKEKPVDDDDLELSSSESSCDSSEDSEDEEERQRRVMKQQKVYHERMASFFKHHPEGQLCLHARAKDGSPVKSHKSQAKLDAAQKWIVRDGGRVVLESALDLCLAVSGTPALGASVVVARVDPAAQDAQAWTLPTTEEPGPIVLTADPSLALSVNEDHHVVLGGADTAPALRIPAAQSATAVPPDQYDQAKAQMSSVVPADGQTEVLFDDPEFVCSAESVGELLENRVEWKRARDILGPSYCLWDEIHPNDIQQGALGDCWLLSSLSVLAEHPHRVQRLFVQSAPSPDGLYGIRLVLDGIPTVAAVDEWIPVFIGTDMPAFSRNCGPESWVMLLEKAYAKVHGSFAAIEGGAPGDALSDLTGAPYETRRLNGTEDLEQVWADLVAGEAAGYLLAASVPDVPDADLKETLGLIEGHAYALLDARVASNGARVVKVRNPWGSTEWNGDWSDGWDGWTPTLKQELGWEDADDGVFWMCWTDFCKHFSRITIVFVNDAWSNTGVVGAQTEKLSRYTLTTTAPLTKLRISVHQKRGAPTLHTRVCVVSADGKHEPYGGSSEVFSAAEVNCTGEMSLKAGQYRVVVDTYTQDAPKFPACIHVGAYADQPVSLELSDDSETPFMLPSFVEQFGRCSKCAGVLGTTSVSAIGQKFHPDCFTCDRCDTALEGSFYVLNGKGVCAPCVDSAKPKCCACNQSLSGSYITVLGGKWHPSCFKCSGCQAPVEGPFYSVNNKPRCTSCGP